MTERGRDRYLNRFERSLCMGGGSGILEHRSKLVYGFTSKYNCKKLVWYETFNFINFTIAREKQLKNWHRTWKNELIEKKNPNWIDLAKSWH